MNLNQLYYFEKLAELEHYTKAAEQLSISQPSLSHAISSLEDELGIFLFEKQGRNVRLTKPGRIYLSYVKNALNELKLGKNQIKKLTSISEGHIDLAYISSIGAYFIPNLMSSFLKNKQYKNIRFLCNEGSTAKLITGLKKEKYDLVFCSHVHNEPHIEFVPICEQKLVVIVPKNHPLANNDYISLKDTLPYNLVYYTKESGLRAIVDDLFTSIGANPKISSEVAEDNSIAGLVAANMGIAVVTDNPTIRNFDLKILPLTSLPYKRYVYLAFVKNRYLPPAAQEFKNYTINTFSNKHLHNSDILF